MMLGRHLSWAGRFEGMKNLLPLSKIELQFLYCPVHFSLWGGGGEVHCISIFGRFSSGIIIIIMMFMKD
jgi:hypothetical protein